MRHSLISSGFEKLGLIIKPKKAKEIKNKIDHFFNKNINLGPAINLKKLNKNQMVLNGQSRGKYNKQNIYINKDEFNKGPKYIRKLTSGVSIDQPILNLPELIEVCTKTAVIDSIKKYFKVKNIYIGYVKVRRFFKNDLPEFDTNFFHYDDNAKNLVKLVLYLNDINKIKDGPFVYVVNSKKKKPKIKKNKINKYMIPEAEVLKFYGKKFIKEAYGYAGSGFLADTIGYHKGIKNLSGDRYVVYVNYVTQKEYSGKGESLKINLNYFNALSQKQKKLFNFFNKI